jgi:hypothetical protein
MDALQRRGDLFMAAVAAVVFRVRVLVLCPVATPARDPFWVIRHDFHPDLVPPGRCLVLTQPRTGSYGWAHPASTELMVASPIFGQHAEFMLRTTELLLDWLPGESSSEEEGPAGAPGRAPEILTQSLIDALEEEYPEAQSYQIRACIICATNAEGRCNLLRASSLLRNMLIADDTTEAVATANDSASSAASSTRVPVAPANTGKRRAKNRDKRFTRDSSDDEHILVAGGVARASELAAKPKRPHSATEELECKPATKTKKTEDHEDRDDAEIQDAKTQDIKIQGAKTQDAKIQDPKTTPATAPQGGQNAACSAPVNKSSCCLDGRTEQEQLQLISDAISAVQQFAACSHDSARDRLMLHLCHCKTLEDAATRAIEDLRAPITEIPNDGVSFVERLLGRGVRPANLREMAQAVPRAPVPARPASELRPQNLSRLWHDELADPSLTNLPHGARAKLARRHAGDSLHSEALDELRRFNQQRGAFDSPPACQAEYQAHPNSAVRMAAQRELTQASAAREGPVIVVANSGNKPFQWKQGLEKEQRGFFWSTKQAVQQAWETSNRMDGEHAYRSFKSLVHQSMVPVICFELGLSPTEWEAIPDAELLSRIDAILKPRDSTEYFLKLSAMKVSCDPLHGSLQTRYRAFAEPFIATLAEAVESGMAVNPEQARNAFKAACNGHSLLKLWLSESKWKSVVEMHQRLVKGIKQYEAESVLRSLDCDSRTAPNQSTQSGESKQSEAPQCGGGSQRPNQGAPPRQRQPYAQGGGGAAFQRVQPAAQPPPFAPTQPAVIPQVPPLASPHTAFGNAFVNTATPMPLNPMPRQHGGLDARGPYWHVASAAFGCKTNPCNDVFCQVCGNHGHDASNCKRTKHQQANHHGYFCEQRPGVPRLRYDGPLLERHAPANSASGSAAATHNFAPPPSHYANAQGGRGGNVNHGGNANGQSQGQPQQGSAAINQASQTPQDPHNGADRPNAGNQ